MAASLVFLTPWAALVALVAVVPLAALAVALRRERHARRVLRLEEPPGRPGLWTALGVLAALALLGVAAAQPALRSTTGQQVRTDAEAVYVIDTSRSMLARSSPRGRTRIERARAAAVQLRRRLSDVPSGIATLTDRVLPDLLPQTGNDVFERTVRGAVRVDNPPPQTETATATSLGALGVLGTQNFFSPSARHRLVVVFTDGESRPYDVPATARALRRAPGVKTVFVHVGSPDEAVFAPGGRPEQGYHPDAAGGTALSALADATGGAVVGEGSTGRAAALARAALGAGPTREQGLAVRTRALAPWLVLAALLPLLLAFAAEAGVLHRPVRRREPAHLPEPAAATR
jgi:hypothetical protein